MVQDQIHAPVHLQGVQISYGNVIAVDHVNIDIASGEFFTLLGPSGCGKTTLLRTIAGFNRQTGGSIVIGDTVVDDLPAYKRDTGMVFQNYAIFPHLNVWENVAYGLKTRNVPSHEIDERVKEALKMVDLTGYEKRMPKQMSGGQQQRVVIARAIVIRPRVLLMDEPLANLDAKLRVRLREDLKILQQKLGITTVYVTHDQEEALSISDRIAVMSKGHVLQVGTPEEIYEKPSHVTVARFIGEGTFLKALPTSTSGNTVKLTDGSTMTVSDFKDMGKEIYIGFRPHLLNVTNKNQKPQFSGTVITRSYYGAFIQFTIDCGLETTIMARLQVDPTTRKIKDGDHIDLSIAPDLISVFPYDEDTHE